MAMSENQTLPPATKPTLDEVIRSLMANLPDRELPNLLSYVERLTRPK
jgi:hypothetical protein